MPNLGSESVVTQRAMVFAVAFVVLAAIAALALVVTYGSGAGVVQVKFKDAELNFSVDRENISVEDLVTLMIEGDRADIVAAHLEGLGKLYRFDSPALVARIKTESAETSFAKNMRDLLSLSHGPFSCCHKFVNLLDAEVVRVILELPYDSPTAELLRANSRKFQGIFRHEGSIVHVGIYKDHPSSIAAACRTAEFFGDTVQVYSKRGAFVTVKVNRSFDCNHEDFAFKDNPSMFLQLGLADAQELFGNRPLARTEPASLVISPRGFAPSTTVANADNRAADASE